MPVGGRGGWRVYSRQTEPGWYWSAGAMHLSFIVFGIVGTLYPRLADDVVDIMAPLLLVVVLAMLAIIVYSTTFKRRSD